MGVTAFLTFTDISSRDILWRVEHVILGEILVLICLPERLDMPRRLRIMTQFGCTQIHIGIIIGISQNKEWVKKIN